MVQKDIIYNNFLLLLKNITQGANTNLFATGLGNEALEDRFIQLIVDGLDAEIKIIEDCHEKNPLPPPAPHQHPLFLPGDQKILRLAMERMRTRTGEIHNTHQPNR